MRNTYRSHVFAPQLCTRVKLKLSIEVNWRVVFASLQMTPKGDIVPVTDSTLQPFTLSLSSLAVSLKSSLHLSPPLLPTLSQFNLSHTPPSPLMIPRLIDISSSSHPLQYPSRYPSLLTLPFSQYSCALHSPPYPLTSHSTFF